MIALEAVEDQGTSNALLFPPSTRPARALLLPPFKQQAVPSCSSRNAAAQTHMRSNNRAATTAQQQPRCDDECADCREKLDHSYSLKCELHCLRQSRVRMA